MDKVYSIAEARNDLSGVVREVEAGRPVTLSRRGRPVAVVVSVDTFARMAGQTRGLRDAIDQFRHTWAGELDDKPWIAARDPAAGRTDWRP